MAQVPPDVAVTTDAVAQEHRRRMASLPPRFVKQGAPVAWRDGVPPRRRHPLVLRDLFLVFLAGELVHRWILHDLLPCDLPRFLDDPRQRPILPGRFVLDFLEHVFRKVQGLLAFIRAGHTPASFEDRLHGVKTSAGVWTLFFEVGQAVLRSRSARSHERNLVHSRLSAIADALFATWGVVMQPSRHYPIALFHNLRLWL